uniref:F-box associated domain-containing protein n=1 Tax=Aegilops tauschii TaxID=37682 RepID=M8AMX2_AEGTA
MAFFSSRAGEATPCGTQRRHGALACHSQRCHRRKQKRENLMYKFSCLARISKQCWRKKDPPRVPEPPSWVDQQQTYLPRLFGEDQLFEDEQDDDMDMEQGKVPPLDQKEGVEALKEKVVPLTVYLSCTGHWENREFAPGDCAPGHLYDMVTILPSRNDEIARSSEYWRGSLYVHCYNSVLMILRPSKGTYDMVQLPGEPCGARDVNSLSKNSVLASYERGIHYVGINQLELQVWMLNESIACQLGWTRSHEADLNPPYHMMDWLTIQPRATWEVVGSNSVLLDLFEDGKHGESIDREENFQHDMEDENHDGVEEEEDIDEVEELGSRGGSEYCWNSDEDNFMEYSWNSDKDNIMDVIEGADLFGRPSWLFHCKIMGFHPYKHALILLLHSLVVVYHLDTSRMQYLGEENTLIEGQLCWVYGSFPLPALLHGCAAVVKLSPPFLER